MEKRGQVTVYIIIGVLIVLVTLLYILARHSLVTSDLETEKAVSLDTFSPDSVRAYVDSCFKRTAENAILLSGLQGGLIYPRLYEESLHRGLLSVPYYFSSLGLSIPQETEISTDASFYISQNIRGCLVDLNYPGYELEYASPNIMVEMSNDSIYFKMSFPISLSSEEETISIDGDYTRKVPTRYFQMFKLANEIAKNTEKDPMYIDLSRLNDIKNDGFNVYTLLQDNDTAILYIIEDNIYKISNSSVVFEFGVDLT